MGSAKLWLLNLPRQQTKKEQRYGGDKEKKQPGEYFKALCECEFLWALTWNWLNYKQKQSNTHIQTLQ